jgi:aspartyl-tRNA(Asn)/glutamyl-tRNA(Gln) amidotransferase subunit C
MDIDNKTIAYLSSLSKLKLTDSEKEHRKNDLKEVLDYIERLNALDTNGVLEMSKPYSDFNNFREDLAEKEFDKEVFLANAPKRKEDYFKVVKILDSE